MIEARELRIGNWVSILNVEAYRKIDALHIVEIYDGDTSYTPITLTEEILLKCGWVWNNECDSYEKYPNGDARLNITKPSSINEKRIIFNYVLCAKISEVTYLHQLQNLYFALTGKELEIQL